MKTVYILVHDKAWNRPYAVDVCIKYISESKESVEEKMNQLIKEDKDFNVGETYRYLKESYNKYQDFYRNEKSWDPNTRKYVSYNVDLEIEEYKNRFYKSYWIKEINLDTEIELEMGSYYE